MIRRQQQPQETASLFDRYLKEQEEILWMGQPKKGIQIRDADMLLIPMSIILLGFSLILDYMLTQYQSSFAFKILGIMLASASVYIGIIRFFVDSARRASTFYCITNRRVIVMKGKKKQRISTLPLRNIEQMDITVEKDGSGFITFGSTNPLYPWLFGVFYFASEEVPGLALLPDVNQVYQLLLARIKIDITPSLVEEIRREEGKEQMN